MGDEKNIRMVFSSEPDILFEKKTGDTWHIVATIEIKSGTDPAGALERLGALQKSFANTPARSKNFAVLGVITPKMVKRLNEMHVEKYFSLWEVMAEDKWNGFVKEIFHHTLRLIR
ncbi:MAG: XcyI family restriction endonuclease [Thaumarchaeota archaeon]|nr:XcyI family restriction endonuclease [Nitrososphaerota archaeon]